MEVDPTSEAYRNITQNRGYAGLLVEADELTRLFGADIVLTTDVSAHPIKQGLEELWRLMNPPHRAPTGRIECHRYPEEQEGPTLDYLDASPGYHAFLDQLRPIANILPGKRIAPPILAEIAQRRSSAWKILSPLNPLRRKKTPELRDALRVCVFDEELIHNRESQGTMSKVLDMMARASFHLGRPVAGLVYTIPINFVRIGSFLEAGMEVPVMRRFMETDPIYANGPFVEEVMNGKMRMKMGTDGLMPEHTPEFVEMHGDRIRRYRQCMIEIAADAAANRSGLLVDAQPRIDHIINRTDALLGGLMRVRSWNHPKRGAVIVPKGNETYPVG